MVLFEELELGWGVSAEGASRGHGGSLEGFFVLMRVAIDHPIDERIFAPLDLDILGWLVVPIG